MSKKPFLLAFLGLLLALPATAELTVLVISRPRGPASIVNGSSATYTFKYVVVANEPGDKLWIETRDHDAWPNPDDHLGAIYIEPNSPVTAGLSTGEIRLFCHKNRIYGTRNGKRDHSSGERKAEIYVKHSPLGWGGPGFESARKKVRCR